MLHACETAGAVSENSMSTIKTGDGKSKDSQSPVSLNEMLPHRGLIAINKLLRLYV